MIKVRLTKKPKVNAFTLMEMIIVVIIIGTLATLGIMQYGSYKERTLGKEAIANLKLLSAAERVYRMEYGFYYPYTAGSVITDHGAINNNLKLLLKATNSNWAYQVTRDAGGAYTGQATRRNCTYSHGSADFDAEPAQTAGSTCP